MPYGQISMLKQTYPFPCFKNARIVIIGIMFCIDVADTHVASSTS